LGYSFIIKYFFMQFANENDKEMEIGKLAEEIQHEEGNLEGIQDEMVAAEEKLKELSEELKEVEEHHKDHVFVALVTTSGSWPKQGFDRVPEDQPVKAFIARAVAELRIVDTKGWIATVDGREIDPEKNYKENRLCGEVCIDYKPKHGGGGGYE
jgi:hypothetical protein